MLVAWAGMIVIYAWWAPSSWLGCALSDLAQSGARRWSRMKPLTIFLILIFVGVLAALLIYAPWEGLRVAIPAGAEGLAWFATMDLGTYVEVMAAAWLLSATGILRTSLRSWRSARKSRRDRCRRHDWRSPSIWRLFTRG